MYSRVRLQLEGPPHSGGPGYILNDCCQLPRGLKSIDKKLPARSSAPAETNKVFVAPLFVLPPPPKAIPQASFDDESSCPTHPSSYPS
jgi:hypothetical protein